MKKRFLFSAFLLILISCKKDEPDPVAAAKPVVGKWRPVEHSKDGGMTYIHVADGAISMLIFRFDGVIVNEEGYKPCCSPKSYTLNGSLFEVKPQAPLEADPSCIYVDCVSCEDVKITVKSKDELVTEYCNGNITKFVRVSE